MCKYLKVDFKKFTQILLLMSEEATAVPKVWLYWCIFITLLLFFISEEKQTVVRAFFRHLLSAAVLYVQ